ncbi:hypothetical protein P43SY_004675 [Pythium insidiosum]|uniref:F-box domain-containing protein n=1 Tax=Pythium insidiosum TaxID=114742 RepID=A0AAD5LGB6_PYTIN|nr:hypothetical protein P43SY_004675 [Pythium insidiosum]
MSDLPQGALSALEALPQDVWATLLRCLTGAEVLQLSHASRRLHRDVTADPAVWTSRLLARHATDVYSLALDAKREYLRDVSFGFRGQLAHAAKYAERGACVTRTRSEAGEEDEEEDEEASGVSAVAFSFDLWLALLPSSSSVDEEYNSSTGPVFTGGIVLGAQSVQWIHTMVWAHYHQQLVHVDPQRNLYCSVTNDKRVVAAQLQPERWYHVALTFAEGTQRVFIDGALVATQENASLHDEWGRLEHMQLGTGCISGASIGKPKASFCGWYGFHGLVDEYRAWTWALSEEDVALLAQGQAVSSGTPAFSLKHTSERVLWGAVDRVQCPRPLERLASPSRRIEGQRASSATPPDVVWDASAFHSFVDFVNPSPHSTTVDSLLTKLGVR